MDERPNQHLDADMSLPERMSIDMTPEQASGEDPVHRLDVHDFYVVIGFDGDGATRKPVEMTYTADLISALEFFRSDIVELDLVVVLGASGQPTGVLATIVSSGPFPAVLKVEELERIGQDFVCANRPWTR